MVEVKITDYTAETAPVSADLVEIVDDVAGTPTSKKATIGDLTKGLSPNALTAKSAPVPADEMIVGDTEASNVTKKSTLAELNPAVNAQITVNAETASFTFALTDRGKWTTISNASATTATIPPNSSVAFPTNTVLTLEQIGAGACTWTEGSGVTIETNTSKYSVNGSGEPTTNGQHALSFARKTATDTWVVYGDLAPLNPLESMVVPLGNEDAALTASTSVPKYTLYADADMTLTDIQGFITTAPTDATLIGDVHLNGTTIMSTNKVQIETGEFDSDDATTQPALTTTAVTRGDKLEFFVDQIGSTIAGAGFKIALTFRRT